MRYVKPNVLIILRVDNKLILYLKSNGSIIRKVIFSKVLNIIMMLIVLVAHGASSKPNIIILASIMQKRPILKGNCCLFSRFWSVFDIHGTKYCHLRNTCWPNFFWVIIMLQSHPLPNIMVVSTLEQKIFHFKGCCD